MAAKWGRITAGDIATAIQGTLVGGSPNTVFSGLSTDSRQIEPGCLFWALKGEKYDGQDFAEPAVREGAAGVVIRDDGGTQGPRPEGIALIAVSDTLKALGDLARWWRSHYPIPLAAITGSAGKTTTKEMTATILALKGETLKNEGNLNNLIGLPITLLGLEEKHLAAVVEMGMNRPGEIGRLTEIADPDIGLITNVARAHIEGLGSLEAVAKAKVELVGKMSSRGQVILNGDDALLVDTASAFRRKVMTFGLGPGNDFRAHHVRTLGREGLFFELRHGQDRVPVKLQVPGLQNVVNAMAASAIALCMGAKPEQIAEGLSRFAGIQGRFMIRRLPGGASLVDDTYNANPFSLKFALDSLKGLAVNGGRVIVGLGEMLELGEETIPAHLEAGAMVAELGAHYFVVMGEHAREMIQGALEKGFPSEQAAVAGSHEEMAKRIKDVMKKDDLVLLKGSRRSGLEEVARILMGEE
jgi:UDP-N-acetylmuramoyl-tripeptide--D-alanyl-D-alanine ligase